MRGEVYPSPDGWRFRIKGNNNEIMATGEAYVRRYDAESALRQVVTSGHGFEVTIRNHGNETTDHYVIGNGGVPFSSFTKEGTTPPTHNWPRTLEPDTTEEPDDDGRVRCPGCHCVGFHTSDCPVFLEGADDAG